MRRTCNMLQVRLVIYAIGRINICLDATISQRKYNEIH
jgi:hypothetical protein